MDLLLIHLINNLSNFHKKEFTECEGHDIDFEDFLDTNATNGSLVPRKHSHCDLPSIPQTDQ